MPMRHTVVSTIHGTNSGTDLNHTSDLAKSLPESIRVQRIGVLLADAHPIFRQGLRALLDREPDIDVLGDTGAGAQVADLVDRLLPKVVVMDARLPDSAGPQLTTAIRHTYPHVEVLVLTTHDNPFHVLGMLRAGAIRKVNRGEPVLDPAVVNTVLDNVHQSRSRPNAEGELTDRERKIIGLIAAGMTSREIANALGLSPKTIDNIRGQILQKLHARNKVEAITTALEHGVIRITPSTHGRKLIDA
jgi:two-component system response regulator DevR